MLLNNTLRNTRIPPPDPEIISFRDFNGAFPLVVSFANNANHLIAGTFTGRLKKIPQPVVTIDVKVIRRQTFSSHFSLIERCCPLSPYLHLCFSRALIG